MVLVPDGLRFRECLDWAFQFDVCRVWLAKRQQPKYQAYFLYRFCSWCSLEPPQLLDLKRPGGYEAERLLDRFVAECQGGLNGFTNPLAWTVIISVKSFFMHNYLDLARRSGKIDLIKQKPYHKPTKESLRRLYKAANNPRDRLLLMFVNSTAIAQETLTKLKWSHLEEDWEKQDVPGLHIGSELLKGHGRGKWKGVEQHTFLTLEAKQELLFYRDWLRYKKIPCGVDDYLFVSVEAPFQPLTTSGVKLAFRALALRANVAFSCHDGRRYVQTALEELGVSPNWIQKIKGRKVRGEQNPYSQPEIEKLRQKFREALPLLSFLNEESGVTKAEIKDLKEALGEEALRRQDIEKQLAESPKVSSSDLKTLQELGEILKEPGAKERFIQFLKELPKELA